VLTSQRAATTAGAQAPPPGSSGVPTWNHVCERRVSIRTVPRLPTTVPPSYLAQRRLAELRVWWFMRRLTYLTTVPRSERVKRRLAEMRMWCALTRMPRLTTARRSAAFRRRLGDRPGTRARGANPGRFV
jgi:hypothetical protein